MHLIRLLEMTDRMCLCVVISLLFLVTGAAFMLYSGLLSEINVQTGSPPIKNITFAYKFKQGPYKKCGQLFKESLSIGPKLTCIGIFYDDPKKVNTHDSPLLIAVSFNRNFAAF